MKYLIFIVFLLCSIRAFGQNPDLIVTTTGDSLKCKIVEVSPSEFQFRFGTGGIITIERNQVASFQYNFTQTTTSSQKTLKGKQPTTKKEKTSKTENLFYAAITFGGTTLGTYSIAEKMNGNALLVGADIAYFFSPSLGAGLKLNMSTSDVKFSDYLAYREGLTFIGLALYGQMGNDRLVFTAGAGAGALNWRLSNVDNKTTTVLIKNSSFSTVGGFLSAGLSYMLTHNIGVGMNVQTVLGTLKDNEEYERKPTGIGVTIGGNFRF